MNEHKITIQVTVSRRTFVCAAAVLILCCAANELVSESMTMTTYYPAPSGVYKRLTTTGPGNTVLVQYGGSVGIGTGTSVPTQLLDVAGSAHFSGNVSIGRATAPSALSVAGGVQMGPDTSACTMDKEGTLMWSAGALQVCTGGNWTRLAPLLSPTPTPTPTPTPYPHPTPTPTPTPTPVPTPTPSPRGTLAGSCHGPGVATWPATSCVYPDAQIDDLVTACAAGWEPNPSTHLCVGPGSHSGCGSRTCIKQ